jgi:hypothetical protein
VTPRVGVVDIDRGQRVSCTDAETNRWPGIEHIELSHARVAPVSYAQKVSHVVPQIM